jgi:hypothetical protein
VPVDASHERGVLLLDRQVPMASAPVGDGRDGPSQARPARLERRHPSASPSSPPIEGEPEEVEGRRSLAARLPRRRARERQEPGLVRMKAEPEPLEAMSHYGHHPLRVVLSLETDDEIVSVPDQVRLASHPRKDVALEPEVEHVVKVDIAK